MGNVFLIDYGTWGNDPIVGSKDHVVTPSIENHVVERAEELVAYISDPARVPKRNEQDELENTFVKLSKEHFEGKLDAFFDKVGLAETDSRRLLLADAVKTAVAETDIKPATLLAAPTVSIYRQQSLYDRLESSLKRKGPAYIIPRYPLQADAYSSYMGVIKRCHDEILRYSRGERSHLYYAQIALRWMKGDPMPRIIDTSYNYKRSRGQNPNMATVIRETLNEIERDLRFKYVRLFSCYNAVLEQLLRDKNKASLVGSIPAIPMYLEIGACSTTMISFMGLGLSRYTAAKLRGLARRTDMSQSEAREWIRRQNLDSLDLPSASIKEIRRLIFTG